MLTLPHSWHVQSCSAGTEANCCGHWSRTGTGNWRVLCCGLPALSQGVGSCHLPATPGHLAVTHKSQEWRKAGREGICLFCRLLTGKRLWHHLIQEVVCQSVGNGGQSGTVIGQGGDNRISSPSALTPP